MSILGISGIYHKSSYINIPIYIYNFIYFILPILTIKMHAKMLYFFCKYFVKYINTYCHVLNIYLIQYCNCTEQIIVN